jgi:hypothetical protein
MRGFFLFLFLSTLFVLPPSGPGRAQQQAAPAPATSATSAPEDSWKQSFMKLMGRAQTIQQSNTPATAAQTAPPAPSAPVEAPPAQKPAAPAAAAAGTALGDPMFQVFSSLSPDLQNQLLDESQSVHDECSKKLDYPYFHDCQCIASTFLEARLKRGPDVNRYSILNDIGSKCVNKPGIAGHSYDECINRLSFLAPQTRQLTDKEIEPFCRCFARTMALRYAAAPNPNYDYIANMHSNVLNECYNKQNTPND